MNALYPESNTTSAEEGTAAHWVMAEMLAGRTPAEDMLTPNGLAVTQEMLEGASLVLDTCNETMGGVYEPHIENTIPVPLIHPECFGTPDIWSYSAIDHVLRIVDYKFGHGFVDEYWNQQGLLYMAGIISRFKEVPYTVSFTIVQPRCFHHGEPVRTHSYRLEEATPHLKKLREAADLAFAPKPVATTGPQCEHCPGRHACPTLQLAAGRDSETSTDQQPVDLTPAAAAYELRMLERALQRMEARVTGLKELTTANIRAGAHVPHYKLEPTRGRVAWKVTPEQVEKLGKKYKQKLSTPKVLTPLQAKKLIPPEVVDGMTEIIPGRLQLIVENNVDASRIFGHTSNNENGGTNPDTQTGVLPQAQGQSKP